MEAKDVKTLMEAYASVYEGYGKKKKGDCVSKSEKGAHNCAKKVCSEQWGEGETIFGQHAVPDENGFVSHYDVQFEHGVENDVPVNEMQVLTMEGHSGHSKKTMYAHTEHEGDTISEMGGIMGAVKKAVKTVIGPADQSPEAEAARVNKRRPQTPQQQGVANKTAEVMKNSADLFDIIKGHLIDEGFADTEEAALAIMVNMSEEWRTVIIEQSREGFRNDGRYQLPDGSTTGAVSGALRGLFTGNLPKSTTVVPPTSSRVTSVTQTRKPIPKTPYSKGDDGKLTDFGAGGGKEKMKKTGMSSSEVEQLGRANLNKRLPQIDDYSKFHKNSYEAKGRDI